MVRKRPHRKKVSYSLKNFWAARETTLGRMFYPLSAQGKCFNLAIARIKHPFPFPTIGKNKFLPLVFLWLPKIFQDIGTVILFFLYLFLQRFFWKQSRKLAKKWTYNFWTTLSNQKYYFNIKVCLSFRPCVSED